MKSFKTLFSILLSLCLIMLLLSCDDTAKDVFSVNNEDVN